MKISIIGTGVVGKQVGEGLSKTGHTVVFYDVVKKELPGFTLDLKETIQSTEVSFICVPTPSKSNGIDPKILIKVIKKIGRLLQEKNKYHLIVIKSTIVPTTTERVVIPTLQKYLKNEMFGVCFNPEFLTEIADSWTGNLLMSRDFFSEDRIVIGESDKKAGDILESVYSSLSIPIYRMNLKTAEMIKYASNCMLATKISYWNEIFLISEKIGVDSTVVSDIVCKDSRIGFYGNKHKKAFGGKCLPKDLHAFIRFAKKHHKPELLESVENINNFIRQNYGVRE